MLDNKFVLGIDTSNYKTSIALVGSEGVLCDKRKFLEVKAGERGLRQSEALFQHVKNIPEMLEEIKAEMPEFRRENISAIAYSTRPRPVEGSYMPCFLAGSGYGKTLALTLGVPFFETSHQEGHIAAVDNISKNDDSNEFIACHFSGGTCEVLKVKKAKVRDFNITTLNKNQPLPSYNIHIIGGSKDISFGQVLDRTGVLLGLKFPCGEELDKIALKCQPDLENSNFTPIKVRNGEINLSGFETQIKNKILGVEQNNITDKKEKNKIINNIVIEIFDKITESIYKMILDACKKNNITEVLISGGVASSQYIRAKLKERIAKDNNINIMFGKPKLSSDNAVGVAILGLQALENKEI